MNKKNKSNKCNKYNNCYKKHQLNKNHNKKSMIKNNLNKIKIKVIKTKLR
jgi:uncharacterized CHY-type Zn-finger protein